MSRESPKPGILEELKRRNVFRVAAIYGAVGWLAIEISSTVLPTFGSPEWILQVLTFLVMLGFPLALVLAWAFELTPEGLRRDADVDRSEPGSARSVGGLDIAIVLLLVVALGFFALDRFGRDEARHGLAAGDEESSVAVLPFENMSRDPSNEPFTIGIHDDLVTHISRIGSIKTISRTSVLQYRDTTKTIPQIAAELGVATILEGGVQRAGDRLRVNVQLIDAATDEHIWSETYDRQVTAADLFAIQSEIATSVAEALRVTLSSDEQRRLATAPTQNLAAVETYFLGKQLLERRTRESLFAAVEYFQQVIELDPDFALGHSGLADAYFLLPEYVPDMDWQLTWEKSEAAAKRALALDPELAEGLNSMGWNRLIHYYDWEEAETLLRRALQIQSNNTGTLHWLSHVLSWQGEHDEALALARRAVEVDPNSRLMRMHLSYVLMDARDYGPAIELAHDVLRRHPDHGEQYGNLWLTFLRAGRPEDASDALEKWAEQTGRDLDAVREVGNAFIRYGETGEPQLVAQDLIDRAAFGSEDLGQVYAFLGDREHALGALERAYEERAGSRSVLSMKLNPGYDFIRQDPRFQTILEKVGLSDAAGGGR